MQKNSVIYVIIWSVDKFTHCYLCKVCVHARKHRLYYCIKCNNCVNIKFKSHNSIEEHEEHKEEKKEDCPICLEKILIESDECTKLLCSHHLHQKCYEELIKNTNINKKYLDAHYAKNLLLR